MPAPSTGPDRLGDSAIVRILRGREGVVGFDWVFEPRFDYGRGEAEWSLQERCGARAEHGDAALTLLTESPLRLGNRGVEGRCVARAGEETVFVLTWRQPASGLWRRDLLRTAHRALDETVAFWRRWIGRCAYRGEWEAAVRRSALTLKLLDYAPTGAMIAAPTTSLPEHPGGVRNWDYRYTWLRDTAFTLYALYALGYREEGESFLGWVLDVTAGDPVAIQPVYGVGGEWLLEESELPHLEGYEGSRPVRVGNAAYRQRQHDVYGELHCCPN